MFDPSAIKLYVDGSCLKNPGGPGGFCVWLEYPLYSDKTSELIESRGFFHTTSNRMELRACLFAHEWILENRDSLEVQHIQIVSDSKYVCEAYQWSLGWSTNNWENKFGRQMDNLDLWKELLRLRRKISGRPRISVEKIDRRSNQLAINVDNGCKSAARQPACEDRGFRQGKVGRARRGDKSAPKPYPAAGETLTIKVYGTEAIARDVQSVKFHAFDEKAQDFLVKYSAQTTNEIGNSLHRGNLFRIRMNDIPQNPRIIEILEQLDKEEFAK